MSDETIDALRQQKRLELLRRGLPESQRTATIRAAQQQREGQTGPLTDMPKPRTEREIQRDDAEAAGLIFSARADRIAEAQAEDRARRRRADEAVQQRDHLWETLRDSEGIDYADEWLGGGAA